MIFGGLSEKEVKLISNILKDANIEFTISTDESIMDSNKESMRHNLRHLNSPSISTHVLSIKIKEEDFKGMSKETEKKLLDFGITTEIPEGLELEGEEREFVQKELLKGDKRLIGMGFLHYQVITILGAAFFYFLFKSIMNFI